MKFLLKLFFFLCFPLLLNAQDFFEPLGGPIGVSVKSCFKDANGVLYIKTDSSAIHHKSYDDGDNWTPVVINDSIQIVKLYADEVPNLFAIDSSGILYRSDENGIVWESVFTMNSSVISSVELNIAPNGDLYFVTFGKIQYSSDKGNSWSLLQEEEFIKNKIEFHPDGNMYALVSDFGDKLFKSSDGGYSWEKIFVPPSANFAQAYNFHISNEEIIYISYNVGDLFPNEVISISTDNGESFDFLIDPEKDFSFFTTTINDYVLFGGYTNIQFSKNIGQNWADISTGLPEEFYINHIYIDTDQYIYLSLDDNVLYKSILPSDQITSTNEPAHTAFHSNAYPNPFDDSFEIQLDQPYIGELKVQLRGLQGRLVMEKYFTGELVQVQTDGLASGVYFYQVTLEGEEVAVGKVVRQ